MNNDIDFNKYYHAEHLKYFDCFIGPNGEYYKVRNILDKNDLRTHYIWAEEFFRKNNLRNKLSYNKIDFLKYLIDKYGYIRYSHVTCSSNPIVDFPEYSKYGTYLHKKQIWALYSLLHEKEEYLTKDQIEELEFGLNNNNSMSDNYFVKRLQKINL